LRTLTTIAFASSLLSLLPACSDEKQSPAGTAGTTGTAGSGGSGPTTLELQPFVYAEPELPVTLLSDGDPIELWHAPQSGFVILVGSRVRGLDSDTIEIEVTLRDPVSEEVVGTHTRTVVMEVVPDDPEWMQNDRRTRSQVAHVPLCPRLGPGDVVGREHLLEVHITELYADFTEGFASVRVVPTCFQTDPTENARCACECAENYSPDSACNPPQ